ncbi:amidase signature domain-containing protein [Immersiella caudata]|uniref:Amidase signature domain-containing protein n=1 Tax=Immersiella caudata TaxID=314043 RepID=A0AA39WJS4_9PEZI|nr:amidase signature domain-containing protein [Immersiella caudata]
MAVPSLFTITLNQIAAGLDSGAFTIQDLTQASLARIGEVNEILHAIIELKPSALAVVQSLDENLKTSGRRRGPLFGATILMKDNISVDEGGSTAIGTETCGSLIYPANAYNVVAIKPTLGLVSREATIPVSLSKDTIGPPARAIKDAAAVLSIIASRNPNDAATGAIPFDEIPDYTESCTTSGIGKLNFEIPRNTISGVPRHVLEDFKHAIQQLRTLHVEQAIATEFRVSMHQYLSQLKQNPRDIRTVEDLIELTKNNPEEELPHRDLIRWELASKTSPDDGQYKAAKEMEERFAGPEGISSAMEAHCLDAIITANVVETFKWNHRNDTIVQAPNRP